MWDSLQNLIIFLNAQRNSKYSAMCPVFNIFRWSQNKKICVYLLFYSNLNLNKYILRLASDMADAMLSERIYVIGFSYPVVPKGKARIRVQVCYKLILL